MKKQEILEEVNRLIENIEALPPSALCMPATSLDFVILLKIIKDILTMEEE